jgi:hypothetical protein
MVGINRMKPAVGKSALLFMAAFVWIAAGVMLLSFAYSWLHRLATHGFLFAGIGVVLALVIHHFGFLRIVDKNLARILPMAGKHCLFSFMTWKSYILVAVMASMGVALRHSPVPKSYLAVVYIAIGMALVLSSLRYLRNLRH